MLASIADHLSRSEEVVDIFAAGPTSTRSARAAAWATSTTCSTCWPASSPARSRPSRCWSPRLDRAARAARRPWSSVVLDWDERREAFLRRVRSLGVAVRIFVVHEGPTRRGFEAVGDEIGPIDRIDAGRRGASHRGDGVGLVTRSSLESGSLALAFGAATGAYAARVREAQPAGGPPGGRRCVDSRVELPAVPRAPLAAFSDASRGASARARHRPARGAFQRRPARPGGIGRPRRPPGRCRTRGVRRDLVLDGKCLACPHGAASGDDRHPRGRRPPHGGPALLRAPGQHRGHGALDVGHRSGGPRRKGLALTLFLVAGAALATGTVLFLPWAQPHVENLAARTFAEGQTGLSDHSELGAIERLATSRRVVARVWTTKPQLLRMRVFTDFNGTIWSQRPAQERVVLPGDPA